MLQSLRSKQFLCFSIRRIGRIKRKIGPKVYLSPAPSVVALDSVHSKVVILLMLFIYCLLLLPLGLGLYWVLVLQSFFGVQSSLAIILLRKI